MSGINAAEIEAVERLVKKANAVHTIEAPNEPQDVYWLYQSDHGLQRHVSERLVSDCLETPEELVRYVSDSKDTPIVFVHPDRLMAWWGGRRHSAQVRLHRSIPHTSLVCDRSSHKNQKDFVQILRYNLRGCLPTGSNLLSSVRSLKFSRTAEGASSVQHGHESVDKRLEARVSGVDTIPEEVVVTVPLWTNYYFDAEVACAVTIHTDEQQFSLEPFPGEMERAITQGLEVIAGLFHELATAGKTSVYLGYAG